MRCDECGRLLQVRKLPSSDSEGFASHVCPEHGEMQRYYLGAFGRGRKESRRVTCVYALSTLNLRDGSLADRGAIFASSRFPNADVQQLRAIGLILAYWREQGLRVETVMTTRNVLCNTNTCSRCRAELLYPGFLELDI